MTVWASTEKAHDLFQSLTFSWASTRARCAWRRRTSVAALAPSSASTPKISRWRGREAVALLDQMDRGPARAFHQCRAGARSILVAGNCRGRRRQAVGDSRPAHPRSWRLRATGREHSLQFRVHDERPIRAARALHGGHCRRHQQDAGVVGSWRWISAGRIRHGAAYGPDCPRAGLGPRRGAPAQPHPGGKDAVHKAAQSEVRREHAI